MSVQHDGWSGTGRSLVAVLSVLWFVWFMAGLPGSRETLARMETPWSAVSWPRNIPFVD